MPKSSSITVPVPIGTSLVDQRPLNATLAVEEESDTEWIDRAHIVMEQLIARGEPFTADNVRRGIGPDIEPHHPNAIGALFNSYRARKQIVAFGTARQSTTGSRNGGALRQWIKASVLDSTPTAKEYTKAYQDFTRILADERELRTSAAGSINPFAAPSPVASTHSMSHTRMLAALAAIEELPLPTAALEILNFDLYDDTSPWSRITRHQVHIISSYRVKTSALTDPIDQATHAGALRLIDTAGEHYSTDRGLIMRAGSLTAYGHPQLRLRDQA